VRIIARRLRQHRVVEDHHVDVEERAHFGRRVGRNRGVQPDELAAHRGYRVVEARNFRIDFLGGDLVVGHLQPRRGDQVREADRDAARDAGAVQREARARLRGERHFHR
jgi:hypothetical protein